MRHPSKRTRASKVDKAKGGQTKNLCLTLHREFFDAIVEGTKRTEYRDDKDYWRRRLVGRAYQEVHFRNGYATKAPFMRVQFKGVRKVRTIEGSRFAIRLGKILELKFYRKR